MVMLTARALRKFRVKIISALIAYVVFAILLSSTPTLICGTVTFGLYSEPPFMSDATGIILVLGDGTSYTWAQLPVGKDYPIGTNLTFTWNSPISAGATKRYVWTWTEGLSTARSGVIVYPSSVPDYLIANYKTQYYITITAGTGGTVDKASGWYDQNLFLNGGVSITATPNTGYNFKEWITTGSAWVIDYSDPTTTFYAEFGGTLQATFEGHGSVSFMQSGIGTDFSGAVLTVDSDSFLRAWLTRTFDWIAGTTHDFAWLSPLTVTAEKRYVWASTEGLSTLQSGSIITPAGSGGVLGTYSTEYYVTVQTPTGGTTDPAAGGWYGAGQTVPISATPSANYSFSNWITTGGVIIASPTASSTTFNVGGAGTIMAQFTSTSPNAFTVTIQSSAGGSTIPSGSNSYQQGAAVSITANPSPGYQFSNWGVSGASTVANPTSPSTTLTINGPSTVTANFNPLSGETFTVTIQSSDGGSINPSGSNSYSQRATIAITATPSSGYQFTGWSVTGNATVEDLTSPSTTLIADGPSTVTANFEASGGGVPPELVAAVVVTVIAIIGLGFYFANNPAGQEILKNIWEIRKNIRTPRKKEAKKEAERTSITESPLTFALTLDGSTIVQGEGTGQLYEDKIVILPQTGKSLSFPLQMISEIRAKDYIIVIIFIAGEILTLSKLGQRYDDFVKNLARLRK